MNFYPKSYFKSIIEINIDFLLKNNIKGVLLDIDNTLLDHKNNIVEGLEKWVDEAKNKNIKFCILSNTNSKRKAEKMSKLLDIPYVYFAKKPLKCGFNKAKTILNIKDSKEIAVVGDQVMTDVWGANRSGMYSILVEPINENDIWVTKINRIIERRILKKYLKNNVKNNK